MASSQGNRSVEPAKISHSTSAARPTAAKPKAIVVSTSRDVKGKRRERDESEVEDEEEGALTSLLESLDVKHFLTLELSPK